MSAEQEARDEAVRQVAHTAWCHAAVAAMTCNCDAEVWRDGFTAGATWQAARDAETIAGLEGEVERLTQWKDEALPVMAGLQDLGRILGVRLGTSITGESAAQAARALVARADAAEARVRAVEAERDDYRDNPRDEHHTMAEVYDYRMLYNAHAARGWLNAGVPVVKSRRHSDGEPCFGGGWFIVTATLPTGQVSNHYRDKNWDLFDVPEVDLPPEYDGHTPADAADRLRAALATPEPTVQEQTADYGPMGDPACETGPDETYCRVCKRLALDHLPSEWSHYGTCPTQAWPQEDS